MTLQGLAFGPLALAQAVNADNTGGNAPNEEVIIEARKTTPQSINPKATTTQDVITTKQLSEIPVTTDFIQALQYLPNVDVYEAGGNGLNGSSITINGFDQTRLSFTLDGIPVNDNDSYSFYSNEFAQNPDISQISVNEGAGSATTIGLSAFGGSVDILTKDPTAEHGAALQGAAGSFGTFSEYAKLDSGEFLKDVAPTSAFLSYSHATSEGYFNNSNTDYKNSVMFKSNTQVGPGTFTLFFTQNQQQFHYYNGCQASAQAAQGDECNQYGNDPKLTTFTGYQINRYEDSLSYAGYSLDIGSIRIDNKVFFYYGQGFGGGAFSVSPTTTNPLEQPYAGQILPGRSWNNTNRSGDVLTATIPFNDALKLQVGALYQHSNTDHYDGKYTPVSVTEISGDRVYDEGVITQTAQPYANLQITPFTGLTIDAGAKYLIVDRDFYDNVKGTHAQPVEFKKALPSIGVNYELTPGYHVYANYTENARAPGYNQFYTGVFNQDLDMEHARTEQAGVYVRSGAIEGRVSGFYTKYDNYIMALQVEDPNAPGSFINRVINAGDAEYYGASLALTYQMTPWLSGFLNAGWLHTNVDVYDGPATSSPKQTVSLGLQANAGGWSGAIAAHYRGERSDPFVDAFGKTNTWSAYGLPSITTVDAYVGYKWDRPSDKSFKSVETKLILTNLTDQQKPINALAYNFSMVNPYLELTEPLSVMGQIMVTF